MPDLDQLRRNLTRRQNEREEAEAREKARYARETLVKGVPYAIQTDFWCRTCELDFNRTGLKVVRTAFDSGLLCAWYATRCEKCYTTCIRFITDKHLDPYYHDSEMLRVQRIAQSRDMLQPGDPGFQTYYGDPMKKYYDEIEQQARATFTKKII
jgi:hypothetical protein